MSANTQDPVRNQFMLMGPLANQGYDWWWHSFTGHNRKTGESKAFFIEYFCINPAQGGPAPILGQLAENKEAGIGPSYVMVKAGCWGEDARQMHRFFAWDDVEIGAGAPYWLQADDCLACDTDLLGSVSVSAQDAADHPEWMCDAGTMIWDLHLDKQLAFNVGYGASTPLRAASAFEMYWHAEGMKTAYSGLVMLDGEVYDVDADRSFGYADKNWGRNFTSPWVWLSSCNLKSRITGTPLRNTAFDIGGGRPAIYGVALERQLLSHLYYEGTEYEFNFSKPWTQCQTEFDCQELADEITWYVRQETVDAVMEVEVRCPKAHMLLVNYEAPDGSKRHNRLWNGGTGTGTVKLYAKKDGRTLLVDVMDARNIGCEYGEYDA